MLDDHAAINPTSGHSNVSTLMSTAKGNVYSKVSIAYIMAWVVLLVDLLALSKPVQSPSPSQTLSRH